MNQKKNHFLLHSSSFWGINPTLFSRNIAQRILGHIFAREIAEFACLTEAEGGELSRVRGFWADPILIFCHPSHPSLVLTD